jgi:radical SAM superfamily enzyme YgiQ (UPF0313 family)
MSNPRIIFVFPPYNSGYQMDSYLPCLGATYIQAYLKTKGVESLQFVEKRPHTVDDTARMICDYETDFVGFTCYDTNYYLVKILAQAIKRIAPSRHVLVGGPAATSSDLLIMEDCSAIDACFRGEAEFTLYLAITKPPEEWDQIAGLTFRKKNKIIRTDKQNDTFRAKQDRELDIFPSPYLQGCIDENWIDYHYILTSRGCAYHCIYCSFSLVPSKKVRYHSIDRIIAEMKVVKDLRKKNSSSRQQEHVLILDECFNSNLKRAKQICRALIDEQIGLPLWTELRAEFIDQELLMLMRKAGFTSVNLGLESAVPEILRTVCKARSVNSKEHNLKREQQFLSKVIQAVRWAKQERFHVTVSIVQGLPGEGIAEAEETMHFLEQLGTDAYYHNQLKIFPGTRLFTQHRRFGIDVTPSESILPYATHHSYDISRTPVGENSDISILGKRIAHEIIGGVWGAFENPDKIPSPHFVLFQSPPEWESEYFSWLSKNIPLGTRIVAMSAKYNNNKERRLFKETMVRHLVPTQYFFFLSPMMTQRKIASKEKLMRLTYTSLYKPTHRIAPVIRQVGFEDLEHSQPSHIPEDQLVLSFLSEHAQKREKQIAPFGVSRLRDLSSLVVKKMAAIEDGCRWAESSCPAPFLRRLIFNSDLGVKTCFASPELGKAGDDLNSLKQELLDFKVQEEENRGCQACPVSHMCAKCLFPHPFTVGEYCKLQKERVFVSAWKNSSRKIQSTWLSFD